MADDDDAVDDDADTVDDSDEYREEYALELIALLSSASSSLRLNLRNADTAALANPT